MASCPAVSSTDRSGTGQDAGRAAAPSRLARKLGTIDASSVGLGAMIGAGVFSAIGPAARAAGNAIVVGLLIAGLVAYCNATSTAALAALYPESGGAYVYGRKRLGALWGFLAGWGFVVGKLASCAAMALTFGHYAFPGRARPLAMAAVVALTAVNVRGIGKTVGATKAFEAAAGTIRGDFALETGRNLVHASDEEPGSAVREVGLWFKESELFSWSRETDRWIYE